MVGGSTCVLPTVDVLHTGNGKHAFSTVQPCYTEVPQLRCGGDVWSFVQLRDVEAPGDVDGQFATIDNANYLGGSTRVDQVSSKPKWKNTQRFLKERRCFR